MWVGFIFVLPETIFSSFLALLVFLVLLVLFVLFVLLALLALLVLLVIAIRGVQAAVQATTASSGWGEDSCSMREALARLPRCSSAFLLSDGLSEMLIVLGGM